MSNNQVESYGSVPGGYVEIAQLPASSLWLDACCRGWFACSINTSRTLVQVLREVKTARANHEPPS